MEPLRDHDVLLIRADNPGMFTLTGTNTWIVGRDPAWIVDPGPLLPAHVDAIVAAVEERGGAGGIVLTHDHADHAEAVADVVGRTGAPVYAARGDGVGPVGGGEGATAPEDAAWLRAVPVRDGDAVGPFVAVATPGHAPDHLAYVRGAVAFTGDAVLGEGSVFVWPDPGSLAGYLAALETLRTLPLELIAPGHGPLVEDPAAKLDQYLAHRRDRERRLLRALGDGGRSVDELLDAAWPDVPDPLRPAAAVTLAAHLDKLDDEGRLPADVERPALPVLRNG